MGGGGRKEDVSMKSSDREEDHSSDIGSGVIYNAGPLGNVSESMVI